MDYRRYEVLQELIEKGASDRALADFYALTDDQFELWDRACNRYDRIMNGEKNG
jgi:hypothetical protein